MFNSNFSLKDKIFFLKELSYLLGGGVSTKEALNTIKNNTENETIKYICSEILAMVNRGETLSRALTVLDEYFSEGDVNIISSGEGIGELPRVLKQLAIEYEQLHSIKVKFLSAMMYPAILVLIIIGALAIVFKLIIPGFLDIIDGFSGVQLPESTKFLIYINDMINNNGKSIFVYTVIVVILIALFASTQDGRAMFVSWIMKMPLVGKIFKLYYVVYFLRYFSLLIYSGLPITKVFQYLRGVMTNPYYQQMCDDILVALNKGESFIPVMQEYKNILPSDVVVLLKVGEETANLEESARNAISLYEEEFYEIVDNLSKVIEPVLILIVGGIVGFIAISLFSVVTAVLGSLGI